LARSAKVGPTCAGRTITDEDAGRQRPTASADDGAASGRPAAPPLAELLTIAAAAWQRLRSGQSLDRALDAALEEFVRLRADDDGDPGRTARLAGGARDLACAATRHLALIDAAIGRLAAKPPAPQVAALLAVALALLLDRSYPEFTVVDQAVEAARKLARAQAVAGFVNAVLRQFLRRRDEIVADASRDDAVRFNVPRWWLDRLRADHPQAWRSVLQAQLEPPPLVLRTNVRRTTVDGYLALLESAGQAATRVGASAVWLHQPVPVDRIAGFEGGLASVQDAGAQLAAPWLEAGSGMRVLDACAAPGGKTAHLAELSDCRIDAVERDAVRARLIGANLRRLGLDGERVRVIVADAADPAAFRDGGRYDRILLDAPCTASGIVRRHPDVAWLRRPSDVAKLATQQARLLDALWPLLAPAGRLLYVVCSVFAEEGPEQAASFVERNSDARMVPLPLAEQTALTLLPCGSRGAPSAYAGSGAPTVHDGFFYALFEKA
jgi:16S rRNA (cytosine967-C5)-methyltransferase